MAEGMVAHVAQEFHVAGEKIVAASVATDRLQCEGVVLRRKNPVFVEGIGVFYAAKPVPAGQGADNRTKYEAHVRGMFSREVPHIVHQKCLDNGLKFGEHRQAADQQASGV